MYEYIKAGSNKNVDNIEGNLNSFADSVIRKEEGSNKKKEFGKVYNGGGSPGRKNKWVNYFNYY